jgi:gamma-glutamyltranspeptidase
MRAGAPWLRAAACAGAIVSGAAWPASAAPCDPGPGARAAVAAQAMVAAAHPAAAAAGCRVLARGGNAVDAAGALRVVAGAAGGVAIPDYVSRALLGVLAHGMSAGEALGQGHVRGQRVDVGGSRVRPIAELERGTAAPRHRGPLEALGYAPVTVRTMRSGLTLIRVREDGALDGAADPRRDGAAAGY